MGGVVHVQSKWRVLHWRTVGEYGPWTNDPLFDTLAAAKMWAKACGGTHGKVPMCKIKRVPKKVKS